MAVSSAFLCLPRLQSTARTYGGQSISTVSYNLPIITAAAPGRTLALGRDQQAEHDSQRIRLNEVLESVRNYDGRPLYWTEGRMQYSPLLVLEQKRDLTYHDLVVHDVSKRKLPFWLVTRFQHSNRALLDRLP